MLQMIQIIFFTFLSSAASKPANNGLDLAKEVMSRYQKVTGVQAQVHKTVVMSLLSEKSESTGELLLSQGRFRMEFKKPNASTLIMNKKTIWLITPGISDDNSRPQVLKINSKDFMRQTKSPVALLLGQTSSWDKLKVQSEVSENNIVKLKLLPKTVQSLGDVMSVDIEIDKSKKELLYLATRDELDNETHFRFINTAVIEKAKDSKFEYLPPKNADVTEYE